MAERPRVVVTGVGTVNPLGLSVPETWENLIAGKSGISSFGDVENRPDKRIAVAGKIDNFDPEKYFSKANLSRIHRSAQFSMAAAVEALNDAGLLDGSSKEDWKLANIDPCRVSIRMGTGVAGAAYAAVVQNIIRDKGSDRIRPNAMLQMLPDRVVTVPSMRLGVEGSGVVIVAACASGAEAVAAGADLIRNGRADVVIAGGTEAAIDQISMGSFAALGALSTNEDPAEACRPFDKEANGFIMAEGAGDLILESLESAKARGANIYAEVVGYGSAMDAYHDTDPHPDGKGAIRAMRLALEMAGLRPLDIDYINTHGTSTDTGDSIEPRAIKAVFGEDVAKVAISSTKSSMGHLLGAAGAVEAVVAVEAIKTGMVPPTLNLHHVRPEAEGLDLVPLTAKQRKVDRVMSNSLGFGGLNVSLVFARYQE